MTSLSQIAKLSGQKLNKTTILYVWVNRIRKLGNLLFLVGQDSSGQIQIIVKEKELINNLKIINRGDLLKIQGIVRKKEGEKGEKEIELKKFQLINPSKELPFEIKDEVNINEDTRYHYRYLDLRRPKSKKLLLIKNNFLHELRNFLHKKEFIEIETPILSQSSPEGAKCFVVPSNLKSRYYTLPQSPQIFKQLLMVGGFDKYYQIAKSFRNEDARSNRQIEFSQLDLEMSFVSLQQIKKVIENLLKNVLKKVFGRQIKTPFSTMTYQQTIEKYGTDKPDLRNFLMIEDFSQFTFSNNDDYPLVTKGLYVPFFVDEKLKIDWKKKVEKEEIEISSFVVTWENENDYGVVNIDYFFASEKEKKNIKSFSTNKLINHLEIKNFLKTKKDKFATLIVLKGEKEKILFLLGEIRNSLNPHLIKKDDKENKFVWITDWPLFEYNKETKKYEAFRHPFTIPQKKFIRPLLNNKIKPEKVICEAFDLVCNGEEILSGSVRIHQQELQKKVLETLGYNEKEQEENFGYFLQALEFAAPPHGGIGMGIDRLLAIILNTNNLKELIAFPKNIDGTCSLTGSPNFLKTY